MFMPLSNNISKIFVRNEWNEASAISNQHVFIRSTSPPGTTKANNIKKGLSLKKSKYTVLLLLQKYLEKEVCLSGSFRLGAFWSILFPV